MMAIRRVGAVILAFLVTATLAAVPGASAVEADEPGLPPEVQAVLAQNPNIRYLGQPVRVAEHSGPAIGMMDGRPVSYQVYKGTSNSDTPAAFTVFDVRTAEVLLNIPMPTADAARSVTVASDGRVYIATYFDQKLWQFDPGTKLIRDLGTYEPNPADAQPFGLCAGPGGQVFIATYKQSGLYKYDPATGAITLVRIVNPQNTYLHACAWDPRTNDLYVSAGGHHAELWRIADAGTGAMTRMTTEANTPGLESETFIMGLWLVGDHLFARTKNLNFLVIGTDGVVDHWDHSSAFGGYHVIPSPDGSKVYYTRSSAVLEYDLATATVRDTGKRVSFYFGDAVWEPNGDLIGVDAKGVFRLTASGEYSVTTVNFSQPQAIQKLLRGPDNMMFASGYPTGLAQVDTTGQHQLYPTLQSGQYESAIVRNGLMYLGHYGNARFSSYDPANPTRAPRMLFDGLAAGQDRPFALAYNPELQQAYLGSIAGYGKVQGGLAQYDFTTGKTQWHTTSIIENQSIISVLYNPNDKLVYIGTNVDGGMGIEQPDGLESRLVVWDPVTRTKVREIAPVADREGVTGLMLAPDGKIWGWAEDTLFVYDPATGAVVERHGGLAPRYQPATFYWAWAYQYLSPVDGKVYATVGSQLLRIDPATRAVTVLAKGGPAFGNMDDTGDIYFSHRSHAFKYVVPAPVPNEPPTEQNKCQVLHALLAERALAYPDGYRPEWRDVYERIERRVDRGDGAELEREYCG